MSTPWQDRRGMFQSGKAVHEPARRTSIGSQGDSESKAAKPGGLATLAAAAGLGAESSSKFIYRRSKEVHEPSRKKSMSESKPTDALPMPTSPTTSTASTATPSTAAGGAAAGRRRSSASSTGARYSDLLSNPTHAERRQSWEDMKTPGGFGGIFGGLLNKGPEKK